jgi:hypothetical protein
MAKDAPCTQKQVDYMEKLAAQSAAGPTWKFTLVHKVTGRHICFLWELTRGEASAVINYLREMEGLNG